MNFRSKLCVVVTLASLVFVPACVNNNSLVANKCMQREKVKYKPHRANPNKKSPTLKGFMKGLATVACIGTSAAVGAGVAIAGTLWLSGPITCPCCVLPVVMTAGPVGAVAGGVGAYFASRKVIKSEDGLLQAVSTKSVTAQVA